MKDTNGNPITEEEFMKDIGHGVVYIKNNWKDEFDNYFLEKMGKDDGYTEERRVVKDFIESLLADARSESYTNGYRDGYDQQKKELINECITLSDLIESQNITVFDEWRAFKQFRNTLRNKLKHHG